MPNYEIVKFQRIQTNGSFEQYFDGSSAIVVYQSEGRTGMNIWRSGSQKPMSVDLSEGDKVLVVGDAIHLPLVSGV